MYNRSIGLLPYRKSLGNPCQIGSKHVTDIFTKAKRRAIMQKVRRRNTEPEAMAGAEFRELGIRFRRTAASLPGKPDFYFPDMHLVVFVHGCFWHGHPRCRKGTSRPKTRRRYWAEKIARNRRRDRRVARALRAMGLSVYVVWECELRHGGIPARVVTRLRQRAPGCSS